MAIKMNGLIYYKLDANTHGYEGDITKNCGLRGEEIDGNFNFLRGTTIKNISFDEDGKLHVTKYNGEVLIAEQIKVDEPDCGNEYDFKYDSENGILTIITPQGNEIVLTGFKQENNTTIYHDHTLGGDGTKDSPINVSNIIRTGCYKPVIKFIDTTIKDENGESIYSLPNEMVKIHDRYVTKETYSKFGMLYSLDGTKKIDEHLKEINSDWHVPTKEEWDEMLNAIDYCTNPNHNKLETNIELGEYAGTILKSNTYWEPISDGKVLSEDGYGFCVYPVGYCIGGGKRYYSHFGLSSAFWTSTVENGTNEYYAKKFEYNKETVGQYTFGEGFYLSLRLVKKFNGSNYNDTEDIDGLTVNCVHIPGTSLIWTKENIGFTQESYDGFVPEKWNTYEEVNETNYFINDWNGNDWDKHILKEGESIVIHESETGEERLYILVNGTLIDRNDTLKNELNDKINVLTDDNSKLWQYVENETSTREQSEKEISNKIQEEIINRENSDTEILETINNEVLNREKEILLLKQNLEEFKDSTNNNNTLFVERLDAEISRAISADESLKNELTNEKEVRQKNEESFKIQITDLFDKIYLEEQNRVNEDNTIRQKIDDSVKQITQNKVSSIKKTLVIETNENGTNLDVNVDNNTIVVDENGMLSVASEKLTQYVGENSIQISDTERETKTVSLLINKNDNILINDNNGLLTSLSLKWVHADTSGQKDEIQLLGKNGNVISSIDVADFIKDGMLDNVVLNKENPNYPYLSFTFNSASGKNVIDVPVKDLVDIYLAGEGLALNEYNKFSIKIDNSSEEFLTVSNDGLKVYGIKNEITSLKNKTKDYVDTRVQRLDEDISKLNETLNNEVNSKFNELLNKISEMSDTINTLNSELTNTKNQLDELKSKAITSITGANNEISVNVENNTAVVGFAEDAYFVAG